MDFTTGVSIFFNLLLIGAFIVDRVYRIKYLKEFEKAKQAQLEAKQLQIDAINERVKFLTELNDDFVTKKLQSQIIDLKELIVENEDKPEIEKQLVQYRNSFVNLEKRYENEKIRFANIDKQNDQLLNGLKTMYDVFNQVMGRIVEAKQWDILKPIHEEVTEKLSTITFDTDK